MRLGPPTLPLGPPVPEQAIVGPLGPPTLPPPGPQTLSSRPVGLSAGPDKFLLDIDALAELEDFHRASVEPPPPATPPTQQATSSGDLMAFYAETIANMRTDMRKLRRMMDELRREICLLHGMKDSIRQILENQGGPNAKLINQLWAVVEGAENGKAADDEAVREGDDGTPSEASSFVLTFEANVTLP